MRLGTALACALVFGAIGCRFEDAGVVNGDECALDTDGCHPDATCIDEDVGWRCECSDGFIGDGVQCDATWRTLSAGSGMSCGTRGDGSLWCWGDDASEQLGDGEGAHHADVPVLIDDGGDGAWSVVSAGGLHACALRDGELWCWGSNSYGQLGIGTLLAEPAPVRVGSDADWRAVSVGTYHTCAIRGTRLSCWGYNAYGQVGDASLVSRSTPVELPGSWDDVRAGVIHTCGRSGDQLACWGYNGYGELGDATTTSRSVPTLVTPAAGWRDVSPGYIHTCGIRDDGLYCWGYNGHGQLGAAVASQLAPYQVSTDTWTSIAAGYYASCGVTGGELRCWGSNRGGQLGDGTATSRAEPQPVAGDRAWTSVSASWYDALAIADDGTGWAWGRDSAGELGIGSSVVIDAPIEVGGAWARIDGGLETTCGLRPGGELACLGWNDSGQLGDATAEPRPAPAPTVNGGTWRAVAAGHYHVVALDAQGGLWSWGSDGYGQVGDGTGTGGASPVMISPPEWDLIAAGALHSCASYDSYLYCWGYNGTGAIGNGTTTNSAVPLYVGIVRSFVAGDYHTCAVFDVDNKLYCWGDNSRGQLGSGGAVLAISPTLVDDAVWGRVAGGGRHTCGIRVDGSLWCWGDNGNGQLGSAGPDAPRPRAVVVESADGWLDVAAGAQHTCAIRSDATLWCWGDDEWGQLGLGRPLDDRPSPVQVGADTDWASVTAGTWHTCGVKLDGTGLCWGRNGGGQLGVESRAFEPTPLSR